VQGKQRENEQTCANVPAELGSARANARASCRACHARPSASPQIAGALVHGSCILVAHMTSICVGVHSMMMPPSIRHPEFDLVHIDVVVVIPSQPLSETGDDSCLASLTTLI